MAVVDAGVVVALLVEPDRLLSGALEAVTRGAQAPHLIGAEVGHVLRRRVRQGDLSPDAGAEAVIDLGRLQISYAPHAGLLDRAWELRHNLSFYDALYVALAERLDVPLLTLDRRVAGTPGLRCEVEVL